MSDRNYFWTLQTKEIFRDSRFNITRGLESFNPVGAAVIMFLLISS